MRIAWKCRDENVIFAFSLLGMAYAKKREKKIGKFWHGAC